jgi:Ca2+-binding RTX toxin-like protein
MKSSTPPEFSMTTAFQTTDTLLADINPLDAAAPAGAVRTSYADAVSDATIAFAEKIDFAAGSNPLSLAIADFDGDGKLDLVTTNYDADKVSVRYNTSTGDTLSFDPSSTFATGNQPYSVTSADVNGDGLLDLIVANDDYEYSSGFYYGTISVLQNTSFPGAIGFADQLQLTTGPKPTSAISADIDGDGLADLITANFYNSSSSGNGISVLRNTSASGKFGFAAKIDFATGTNPLTVTSADVNGDGKLDLITANTSSNNVSVLVNTSTSGAVSFAAKVDVTVGTNPRSVTSADVNGDGKIDLITANNDSDTVSVLFNTSSADKVSFAKKDYVVGSDPARVTTADVDGSGRADIIVTNAGSDTVSVLKNISAVGSSQFFAEKIDFKTGDNPVGVTSADVNGDGKVDLLVANSYDDTVSVLLNTGVVEPALSVSPLSPATLIEGNAGASIPVNVTFTRTGDFSAAATANWAVSGSGAAPAISADFTGGVLPTGSITFAAGQKTATATFNIAGDTAFESEEGFTVTLSDASGARIGTSTATGVISNDDIAPTLSISPLVPTAEGSSGGATSVTIIVTRSGVDLLGTSSASWAVSGSGAVPATGADFVGGALPSGTVNFNAWETTASAIITLAADTAFEPDEDFTVTLTNPVGATLGTSTSTTGVITNDDSLPTLAVTALTPTTLMEGNSGATTATLTFTRSGDTSGVSSATWSVSGSGTAQAINADFGGGALPTGSVTFAPSQPTATATFDIAGDTAFEPNEEFTVTLSSPIGATLGASTLTGTITNDDAQPTLAVALTPSPLTEGNGGSTVATVTVTRSGDLSSTSSANWALTGSGTNPVTGEDFIGNSLPSGVVTFAALQPTATATITVAGDTAFEPNEEFTVTLSNPVGATLGTSTALGTITNDDVQATLSIASLNPPVQVEGNADSKALIVNFTRSGDLSSTASADWTLTGSGATPVDAEDFVSAVLPTGKVDFAAGAAAATATINVAGDTTFEPNENFTVTLLAPVGATLGTSSAITGTISNDDTQATLALAPLSPPVITEGNSGTTPIAVTVTRTGDLSSTVYANWALTGSGTTPVTAADFVGGTLPSGTVNFAAEEATATITLDVAGDLMLETNEDFAVTLSAPTGALLGTSSITGVIANDDTLPTIALSPLTPSTITEGNKGSTPVTVTVTRSGDLSGISSANWTVSGNGTAPAIGADFVGGNLPSGTVSFPAGQATAAIKFNIAGETKIEPNENFTVSLALPTGATLGTSAVAGTITTDDVNHAPTANNKTLTTDEDVAKTLTVADFGFKDEDAGNTLQSITVTSLPTAGSLTLKGKAVTLDQVIAATDINTGKLVFTPAPDENGSGYADFGFQVSDGTVLSASDYSLTFDITAVRDDVVKTGAAGNDTLRGATGNDVLTGLAGDDTLSGLAGMDTLNGGAGKDLLDGGTDADSMIGGDGDDTYYVDHVGDIVSETNAAVKTGGNDLIYSSLASYTLTANVENGRVSTTGAANLTGNALNNVLIAGAGNNVLDGGVGNDTADYSAAKKAVTVTLLKTTAQATGGSGSDSLKAIENLTGSAFADTFTGNTGANVLNGGTGNDTLTGGTGQDIFRFDTAPTKSNMDKITDFNVKDDTIQLENAIFKSLSKVGVLSNANFLASTAGTAKDANDFIIHDTDSGALFYDADGSGAGAAVQFAIVTVGVALTAADFVIS